ncbi:MAG: tetratricopeptide repeat protein [Deltaproteobacteria bacterium]|nr:tetratricopeptide repeat protein [Deltaproteobacteria bacterium]
MKHFPLKNRTGGNQGSALLLAALWVCILVRPAAAFLSDLTIDKERQIGEEFFLEVQNQYPLCRDPFLISYLNRVGQKLSAQSGSSAFQYQFFIVEEPSMNAFAVPGGYIFITSGFLRMMEREGELAGVLAHEIAHISGRHMAKIMEKARLVTAATLIAALASVFLGGALAQPLLMGSMAAGESAMLKYSRDHEQEADSVGFRIMVKAGYHPRDMISIFNKMNKQRWFEGGKIPIYLSTHPDLENRLVDLAHQLAANEGKLPPAVQNPEFAYFTVKIEAVYGNANQMVRRMTQEGLKDPRNALYPYGKALALARLERSEEATAAFQAALKLAPGNYLIRRDLAIHYFERNRFGDAEPLFRELSQARPMDDVILYYLGRIAQERRQTDQALALFEKMHRLNPTFIDVYLNLGTLYGEKGRLGPGHYYLGLHSLRARAYPTALFHFRKSLTHLTPGDHRYAEARRQVARLERMRVRVN